MESSNHYGCAAARNNGTCNNRRTIKREILEERVLGGLRDRLLQPDLIAAFVEEYQGLEVIPEAGTVIANDGDEPVRTPYDDCVLIMPSRRLVPGQTAVRFGRFVN